MYEGKTRTLFVRYAIPQMIGLLFNSVYMIVDGVFIGNVLGRDSMAAAAVAVPLIEILIALSMAVASGAGILISGLLAQQEKQKALEVFDTALLSAAAIGALVAAAEICFSIRWPKRWAPPRRFTRKPLNTSGTSSRFPRFCCSAFCSAGLRATTAVRGWRWPRWRSVRFPTLCWTMFLCVRCTWASAARRWRRRSDRCSAC